jgi:hypothetical protein
MKMNVTAESSDNIIATVEINSVSLPDIIRFSIGETPIRYAALHCDSNYYVEAVPVNVVATAVSDA